MRVALTVGVLWLAVATAAVAGGLIERLRPPGPQVVLATLTAVLVAAGVFVSPVRRWALALDPRVPVALHLTRFVGAYFLVLYGRGELPYSFAVPGGIGDVVVASLAAVLLLTTSPHTPPGRRLYLGWNVLGLVDILAVVATAAREWLADPGSMRPLVMMPLGLLPTFLVPLIIASHVLLFALLRRKASVTDGAPT
jgi:hypothetical protein